jgi:hypothetical protein
MFFSCSVISGCVLYANLLNFEFGIDEKKNVHSAVKAREYYAHPAGYGKACSSVCVQNNVDPSSCLTYLKAVRPECKDFIESKEREK